MQTEFQPDTCEDVSFNTVPGSLGTAGRFALPWAPRATPASNRARVEALQAITPILNKFKTRQQRERAPVDTAVYQTARESFWSR